MAEAIRLVAVMTHPVQYLAPWFRFVASESEEIDLTVIYISEPDPRQQGIGFGTSFEWDVPLRDGYKSRVLRPARSSDRFGSDSFMGLDAPDLEATLVEACPNVVLVNGWHSVSLLRAILVSRRLGLPLIYRGDSHLGRGQSGLRNRFWRVRTRWLLRRFERYLSVGARSREYLESFDVGHDKIFHSPHAVDNEFFFRAASRFCSGPARAEARRELGFAAEDEVALFVGKLEPNKRPLDLIEAARRFSPGRVGLLFVGAGPLERACRERAEALGVVARFAGFLNQRELGRAYAVSDCLVLPSLVETWGLVVNEALAAGLPVVVSDGVGCAPDLVEPGASGEIFSRGDVAALTQALQRTLEARRRGALSGEACRSRVHSYSFREATKGLLDAAHSLR